MKKKKIALSRLSLNKDVITHLSVTEAGNVIGGETQVVNPSFCVLCYPETQNPTLCNKTQVLQPSVCVLCYPSTHPGQAPC